MSDDTRPDFGKIAQSLGNFTKEASASIDRQIEKKKVKDSVRPGKFCDVCECLFDYRPKPTIILEENHQAPIAEGRCNKCKKEVKAGFIAIKLIGAKPKSIWVKRTPAMSQWPELTNIDNEKLFDSLAAKVAGKPSDTSEYEEKLKAKEPS